MTVRKLNYADSPPGWRVVGVCVHRLIAGQPDLEPWSIAKVRSVLEGAIDFVATRHSLDLCLIQALIQVAFAGCHKPARLEGCKVKILGVARALCSERAEIDLGG